MSKIEHDKYYTPLDLSKYCIDKTFEIIGEENITEIIEPSAGNGSFSNQLDCIAYDLYPEKEGIIHQDYLELNLGYKKGRLIIGNPPYGLGNTLSVRFFKKSIQLGDYIAFIQPMSQLNNNTQMYEFDLIYSEDLGFHLYTDRELNCCLNIYKRPSSGLLNKRINFKLKDVDIVEVRKRNGALSKNINHSDFDIGFCNVGSGSIGVETKYIGQYVNEVYIKVLNDKYKNRVLKLLRDTDWSKTFKSTGKLYISVTKLYKYIKEQIPEIE